MFPERELPTDREVELSIPRLEPDYAVAPYATGPDLIPPTRPANSAPFLKEEPEPVLGPEHGPFVPKAAPQVMVGEPTGYVDLPPVVAPADRWGIPVTDRVPGRVPGSARDVIGRALASAAAGLVVAVVLGVATAAGMTLWRSAAVQALLIVGLVVGTVVPRVWGQRGPTAGFIAAAVMCLAGVLTLVGAGVWIAVFRDFAPLAQVMDVLLADPVGYLRGIVTNDAPLLWVVPLSMLVAFAQAARPRKTTQAT